MAAAAGTPAAATGAADTANLLTCTVCEQDSES